MFENVSHFSLPDPSPVRNITISVDPTGRVFVHWNVPSVVPGPLIGYNLTYQKIGIGDCPDQQEVGPLQSVQVSVICMRLLIGQDNCNMYTDWLILL